MEKSGRKTLLICCVVMISISSTWAQMDEYEDIYENDGDEILDEEPHCIWYGFVDGTHKPKYNTTKAVPPQDGQTLLMWQFCKELVTGDDPRVCCTIEQVLIINAELMAYQGLFNRCPSCFENWRQFYCNYNCGPNQSEFIIVKNTTLIDVNNPTDEEYYEEDYSEEYYNEQYFLRSDL